MTEPLSLFVACAPGLEGLLASELVELGVEGTEITPGGVNCLGDSETVYRINLGSGLGLRVLLRVAEFFVRDFAKLERVAKALTWERWLSRDGGVRVRAHAKRSRLYHTNAIVERIERGIEGRRTGATQSTGASEPTLVQVRIVRDQCTISVDTTGTLLHKRGWRQQTAKAPLREDIARALLRLCGWRPGMALFDPLAGAGTLPIEAATIAAGFAPGVRREFSCMHQPGFDRARFDEIREHVEERALGVVATVVGADRDAGAVAAAQANAVRAGVQDSVTFMERSLGAASLPTLEGQGIALVANPPWGLRVGDPKRLRNLYASFGKLARRLPRPTRIGLVTTEPALARATGLGLERRVLTDQGGVKIGLWTGSIP